MNENKKMFILLSVIVSVVLLIIIGSLYENHKSKVYLNDFYAAFNSSSQKLVMIGRDNCSWCQLFHPSLDFMHEKYGFDYIYVNTNELTSSVLKGLLKDLEVNLSDFGTPLTVVVENSRVIDSIGGYVDESDLLSFLKKYDFVSEDAKLTLNYINYSQYKKLLKSSDSSILVVGQTSCTYCIKAKPVLNKVANDNNLKINYLNIAELSDDDSESFSESLSYLKDNNWGTPLTLIIKNGEVVDSANGLLDYDGYVSLFKNNGFIK